MIDLYLEQARQMDAADPLAGFREKFVITRLLPSGSANVAASTRPTSKNGDHR